MKKAVLKAFPHTVPIFAGFCFLGMTYGIYMNVSGFSFWYPMLMSLTIFAGSVEFVTVNLLLGAFNPIQALVMALMINARHLSEGCEYFYRKSWHPGTDCHRGGSAVTSLEKADAVVHRRRHHLLYVVSAVGFLRKTERK